MIKNTASQVIGAQMITAADGTVFTGATTIYITGDGGTQAIGTVGSGVCTSEGNGFHTYLPSQAETNYAHIGLTFTGSGAIPVTLQVYPTFPQTGDTFALADGATGFVAIDTVVDSILADTGTDGVVIAGAQTVATVTNVTNQVTADVTAISGDSTAADNLEATYDGTGYSDDAAPATQSQIGNLAVGSAAISVVSESDNVPTGTETLTFAVTDQLDGIYHEIASVGNAMDVQYTFDVGGNGTASGVEMTGRLNGSNDSILVQAYNWDGPTWDQIGVMQGSNSSTDGALAFNLLTRHTGTGDNLGKVTIRGYAASGLSSATLYIDQAFVSYAVVAQSVGYANGRVWVDTVNGVAGTEAFVNGVADNPVLTLTDAKVIAANLNIYDFHVTSNSTITLDANLQGYNMYGVGYTLNMAGFDTGGTHFYHASPVNGTVLAAAGHVDILDSIIETMTVNDSHFTNCSFTNNTVTFGAVASDVKIINCRSVVAGTSTPKFDFGLSSVNHNVTVADWQNGMEILNFNAGSGGGTDLFSISDTGKLIINETCDGGTINIRGTFEIIDNSGGGVSFNYDDSHSNSVAILADTADMQPKLGTPAGADMSADIADVPTVAEFETRTPTAAQLLKVIENAEVGYPVTFTTGGSTTTAKIVNVDGSAASTTNDQYNGRLLVFTAGTLKGVVTDITDYVGSTATATITSIPFVPTSSHNGARLI